MADYGTAGYPTKEQWQNFTLPRVVAEVEKVYFTCEEWLRMKRIVASVTSIAEDIAPRSLSEAVISGSALLDIVEDAQALKRKFFESP